MASQQQSVEHLFGAALDRPPAERQAFLDRACSGAPELRQAIEDLLLENERAGSFLLHPLLARPPQHVDDTAAALSSDSNQTTHAPSAPEHGGRFYPGQIIAGRFAIVSFLARGGMGEVYEVEDRFLQGVHVALKVILPSIANDADSSRRFEQEVVIARKITHPNLCPIYDIFRAQDPPPPFLFLTMKLLSGETLAARLRRPPLIPLDNALVMIRQLVSALTAIHAAGVIHRDIKPNNVMLDGSGSEVCVSIMDFGLARLHESEATVLSQGLVAGTPGYVAPELLQGGRPSSATDIFALGVLLHQVLTGERPHYRMNSLSPEPSSSLETAHVPQPLRQCVKDFLSVDPTRRNMAFQQLQTYLGVQGKAASGNALYLPLHTFSRPWLPIVTRRAFAIGSAVTVCALGGGAAWKWDRINGLLHPLPRKRFVAILGWPQPIDAIFKPMLTGVIDAIASELSRAEAFDHDLLIIPQPVSRSITDLTQLNQLRESLGANLVLAASGASEQKDLRLTLRVLEPPTPHPLREKAINVPLDQQFSLPEKAVRAAAHLLDIVGYEPDQRRSLAGTGSSEAFAAFQSAEALIKQDNDAGLEAAIEKYKQAVDLDSKYTLAYAKLAKAYAHLAAMRHDPAALALAYANCKTALSIDPSSVQAHMALAGILQHSGEEHEALAEMNKALSSDPSEPQTLTWQADIYARLNKWTEAEDALERVLRLRPNYWLAHNELGVVFNGQGKYPDALREFRSASLAAPKNALALSNIGSVLFQLGRIPEAVDALRRSIAIKPIALAEATMAAAYRVQTKIAEALSFAQRAVELGSDDSTTWLELGDCHSLTQHGQKEANKAYAEALRIQQEELEADPTDGPGWVLLALYAVKSGTSLDALSFLQKAESLPSGDMDSQLYKARTLDLLGRRDDALSTLSQCLARGATSFQIQSMPDMTKLLSDPRGKTLFGPSTLS